MTGDRKQTDPPCQSERSRQASANRWPDKAALNAFTSTMAAELAGTPVLVNAVCSSLNATWPGGRGHGGPGRWPRGPSVLWMATLPDDGPTGELRRHGQPLPW
jgi:NAD(P)-dependent dehydrogenase (short-subunit alcohol dehydrogenase family)